MSQFGSRTCAIILKIMWVLLIIVLIPYSQEKNYLKEWEKLARGDFSEIPPCSPGCTHVFGYTYRLIENSTEILRSENNKTVTDGILNVLEKHLPQPMDHFLYFDDLISSLLKKLENASNESIEVISREEFWIRAEDVYFYFLSTQLNCSAFMKEDEIDFSNRISKESRITVLKMKNSGRVVNPESVLKKCIRHASVNPSLVPILPFNLKREIVVTYSIFLKRMLSLNNDGDATFLAYFHFEWRDPQRLWSSDGEMPTFAFLHPSEIWHPAFKLYNCLDESCSVNPTNGTLIQLGQDGLSYYGVWKKFQTTCSVSLHDFPLDAAECLILFFGEDQFNISFQKSKILYTGSDKDWEIQYISSFGQNTFRFPEYGNKTMRVFGLHLIAFRQFSYYFHIILLPIILNSLISLFAVWLPIERGEKMSLLIMVFLGYLFLQTIIANHLPKSISSTEQANSQLAFLIDASLISSGFVIMTNCIILRVFHWKTYLKTWGVILCCPCKLVSFFFCQNKKACKECCDVSKRQNPNIKVAEEVRMLEGIQGDTKASDPEKIKSRNVVKTKCNFERCWQYIARLLHLFVAILFTLYVILFLSSCIKFVIDTAERKEMKLRNPSV